MKSILRYIGMKDINLNNYDINSYKTYCEPFGGSFNTGFRLIEKEYKGKLIYNDLDKEVVNFWECIKENGEKVYNRFVSLNTILKQYFTDEERNRTLQIWSKSEDKFKRAAAEYIYREHITAEDLKWHFKEESTELLDMYLTSEMLNEHNVKINNLDYKDIIQKVNTEDTFIMVDPPYKNCKYNKVYRCNSSKFQHEELAEILKDFKGKWLLTYNDNEYIRNLYKEYQIKEVKNQMLGNDYIELHITNK